jgi:hypothetical protein
MGRDVGRHNRRLSDFSGENSMTHSITDHGDFDFLTPNPSDTDKAIAKAAREAIEAHRAWRNDEDAKRDEHHD